VCYPTVRENYRHDRDTSPVNDHQRDLEIHDDPDAFLEYPSMNHTRHDSIPLFRDTFIRPRSEQVSPYFSISFTTNWFTRSHDLTSRDLVTCLQAYSM